jgi:hypothetical protein
MAKDADIPDGTEVGEFKSKAVLGLFDNGCNLVLNVNFKLLDGTIDQSKAVDANPSGTPDRLSPLAEKDGNGIPKAASGWPSYLSGLPARNGMDLSKVIARFVGVNTTDVTGTTVILNFLVFEPGATVSDQIRLDPRLGYPAVTVLQDPTQAASAGDPVSDFCAPLYTESVLKGNVAGKTFRGNPGDGQYNFVVWTLSAPDADNDGIENSLDPCLYEPNTSGWDPRGVLTPNNTPGDNDTDGLPVECDPDPAARGPCNADNGAAGHDQDCDGWANRGDNCPLVDNKDQKDDDSDAIGNACDLNQATIPPETVDGRNAPVCLVSTATIGGGGAAPANPLDMTPCNPNAVIPGIDPQATAGPTPTFIPGTTTRPTQAATGGGGGVGTGPVSGIGSLAPVGTEIPVWAAVLAGVGALGLVFGVGVMGTRIRRRR